MYYLFAFFSSSIFCWLLEMFFSFFFRSKFVLPGVLSGPWCPIYGTTCFILLIIFENKDKFMVNFFRIFLAATIVEYIASYLSEKFFNNIIWNYSNFLFNINGRVCLHMSLIFTAMGLSYLYVIEPLQKSGYIKNSKFLNFVTYIFIISFVLDITVTYLL